MCSSYPAHKSTYLSASSSPIPTQLGTHHLPMYADPLALLSAVPKGCRNQNMDIHKHPLPGLISQKRVRRFSPFFAHRSFTILPTGVPIFSAKFRAHVSSNSLFHESRWFVGVLRPMSRPKPSRERSTARAAFPVDDSKKLLASGRPLAGYL